MLNYYYFFFTLVKVSCVFVSIFIIFLNMTIYSSFYYDLVYHLISLSYFVTSTLTKRKCKMLSWQLKYKLYLIFYFFNTFFH